MKKFGNIYFLATIAVIGKSQKPCPPQTTYFC